MQEVVHEPKVLTQLVAIPSNTEAQGNRATEAGKYFISEFSSTVGKDFEQVSKINLLVTVC